jgi:rhodanese-related sulfurtransferase
MDDSLKNEIKNAIVLGIIIVVAALVVNTARNPILNGLAENGTIHVTTANKYSGVKLIDNWSHKGWPITREEKVENGEDGNGDPGEDLQQYEMVVGRIEATEAKQFFDSGEAVFLDARVEDEYAEGHIKGAKTWPFNQFLEYLEFYETEIQFDTHLVIYCEGGDCDQSESLAEDLRITGFKNVNIYEGGYEQWTDMNMPIEAGGGE